MEGKKMLKMMVLGIVVVLCSGRGAPAGEVVAWGENEDGQCDVPEPNEGFIAVAGGTYHSLGVKADSSIVAWGYNRDGQCNVPLPNEGFVAVAAGYRHSLGLKADGSIVAWGRNGWGQCNVPEPNEGFIEVAAGNYHSLGLKADGSIAAWGRNDFGQCDVPEPNEGFVAVTAGFYHSLGLKADGSIVAWGDNADGQCNVPEPNEGFVAVAGGKYHSLGLKADGSIVGWGYNVDGQCTAPLPNEGFVAVAGGDWHSLGLKADGSIVAFGYSAEGQCNVPEPNEGFVAVAGGGWYSLGLKAEPMGTAFTYQGRLLDANSAADGLYDLEFRLYDSGDLQHGNTVEADDVDVIDGYFTVELDFGTDVFDGLGRWLEIGVRAGDSSDPNAFVTLSPRQGVTPTPYALHAKTAKSIAAGSYAETDPQVGTISNNYVPKWDGSALVTGTIYDNGKVGIGTSSPLYKLDIEGGANPLQITGGGPTYPKFGFNVETGGYSVFRMFDNNTLEDFRLATNGDSWLSGPGNVGIGTMSPGAKLDVAGNIGVSGTVDGVDISAHAANLNAHHPPPTTLPPSGPAGGGLSGTYPSPSVVNDSHTHGDSSVSNNISIDNGRLSAPAGSGNVGIGTTSPTQKLDVAGNVTAYRYYDRDSTSYYVDPASISYCNDMRANIFYDRQNTGYYLNPDSVSNLNELRVQGPVYMRNAHENQTSGRSVYVNGTTGRLGYLISSKRYKENIAPLQDDFSKILGAQAVTFTYKQTKEHSIGLIAEDLDELGLSDLVIYDTKGRPESVRYEFVSLYLLEVVKELKAENELLKEQLKAENKSVKQKLDALEKTIQKIAKAKEVQL